MLRPSRRLSIALLWLAIVLLPLRAGAVLLMPTLMSTGMTQAAQASAAATVAAAAMPCHGAAADVAGMADDASPQTCSWCDLCQANAPQTAWCGSVVVELPNIAPSSPPPAIVSAVPDGLFRPPRTVLA